MSLALDFNPLSALGFGLTETNQTWQNIISQIHIKCGVIDQFEFSDETIIQLLKEHVMPYYSVFDGYPMYHRLESTELVATHPTKVYQLKAPTKIISIRNVMYSDSLYISNIGDNQMLGYGSAGIEDTLISRNYDDMRRSIMPTRSWKFVPPKRFEIIDIHSFENSSAIMLELNTVHPDPSSINPTLYEKFKDLCVNYMKVAVGTVRNQVTSLSTPTGVIEVTPNDLKSEGEQGLLQLKEELKMTPPDKMIYFMG